MDAVADFKDLPLVLFAIPELASGGPDRVIAELIRELPRDRFRVGLAVSHASGRYFSRLPADVAVYLVDGGRYPVMSFARLVDRLCPALVFTTLRMNLTAELATRERWRRLCDRIAAAPAAVA